MWRDLMEKPLGQYVQATIVGNIYDMKRDAEIKKGLEAEKKKGRG